MDIVIIDDEIDARENLSSTLISLCDDINIMAEADSVSSGIALLTRIKPDLVFLDIDLTDGSGFNILEQLPDITFKIVFVTAYNNYAIKAFKVNALDYILKPIDDQELINAVEKARQQQPNPHSKAILKHIDITSNPELLSIREQGSIRFIKIDQIIHCQSDKNYTELHLTTGERIVSSRSLKAYTEILELYHFFRVHQSHLVNLKQIKRIDKQEGYAELLNGTIVAISRRKREPLLYKMAEFYV